MRVSELQRACAIGAALALARLLASTAMVQAQEQAKPNILFIMGDDIGWMQPSIYHRACGRRNAQHRPHRP